MLRIISGRAGTGKSAAVMNEIAAAVKRREDGYILLVPEQYSHEAERELCEICGDSLSLYAEVLSFTALARRIAGELGGGAAQYLDKGGRLLCMALASDGLHTRLKVYSDARRKAELQTMLLSAVDELKTACISAEQLMEASAVCEGSLSDKLHDLALILEAYDAVVANGHADPTDRLTVLAEQIPQSSMKNAHVYIDGFTDFTAQERRVIYELMCSGASVTVCISCDDLYGDSEVLELGRATASLLIGFAKDKGIEVSIEKFTEKSGKSKALSYFADNMFTFSSRACGLDGDGISINAAPNISAECEFAAAKAVEFVRDTGCRWRDIAIAVRGFDDYRLSLESSFKHYGVPLYASRKSDVLSKPLPALIAGAYEIIGGGWELGDVIGYLRTGLAGLSAAECDELENYAFLWQMRGSAWTQEDNWRLHPDGYGGEYDDDANARLDRINLLRRVAVKPLKNFAEKSGNATTAAEQAEALAGLFDELNIAGKLASRAEKLSENGEGAKAQEYAQLWDICVNALEQCAAILGDTETDRESFGRLFTMTLSKYDVGTIPASLDRVIAGDFDRMRRRRIKHLVVLGASDSRLPKADDEGGMFSTDERKRLLEMDIDLGGAGESELWREFSLIYNCLTLPSDTLSFCYPAFDGSGEACRPAFVVSRAKTMFNLETEAVDIAELRMNALNPALELAANGMRGAGEIEASAAEYFDEIMPERMSELKASAEMMRGSLSEKSVRLLYGNKLKLSASRIDKFAACRFAYFMQYGLKAKPREPAGFTPPEMGIFMHYILEHVAAEVTALGGFKKVSDDKLKEITDKYINEYIREKLNDFREKSERFKYLFRRLAKNVHSVVNELAAEMRVSDFEPLSFELDFSRVSEIPPIRIGEGEESLELKGIVDRVDGWVHDDKLYLRVIDYKTGRKSFSLSDVWYGMGLQMLLYLFALGKGGEKLYGKEIVPAGVLYVPARDTVISASGDLSDDEVAKLRAKTVMRSGLILDEPEVINAMEHGEEHRYIPVKLKGGEALASAERLGKLSRHIDETLCDMAKELKRGSIAADPFYRTQQENACANCDYLAACRFRNGENGEKIRNMPRLAATKVWNILEGGEDNG